MLLPSEDTNTSSASRKSPVNRSFNRRASAVSVGHVADEQTWLGHGFLCVQTMACDGNRVAAIIGPSGSDAGDIDMATAPVCPPGRRAGRRMHFTGRRCRRHRGQRHRRRLTTRVSTAKLCLIMPDDFSSMRPWVEDYIRRAAETGSSRLSLQDSAIAILPEAVLELSNLETLNLAGNALTTVPPGLDRLPRLERIDLRRNPVVAISSRPGLVLDWETYVGHRGSVAPEHIVGFGFTLPGLLPDVPLDGFPNLALLSFDGVAKTALEGQRRPNSGAARATRQKRQPGVGVRTTRLNDFGPGITRVLAGVPALRELELFYLGLRVPYRTESRPFVTLWSWRYRETRCRCCRRSFQTYGI